MKTFDVVIIGSGLAGLNSALHAAKHGKVLVVTKSRMLECNSRYAQGGIATVFQQKDTFRKHIEDTLIAGAHHNDKKAVRYFVEHAPETILKLNRLGVPFEKTPAGTFDQNREAGHRDRRIVHVGDHTGLGVMEALTKNVLSNKNITVWQNSFATKLLVKNKTCYGVEVIRGNTMTSVLARRTILATGGGGQLFRYTTNPKVTTGDGIALAARAGCKIKDMEFIQFHPTAFAKGKSPLFLISETLRGEGAKLINAKGERFMPRYHKLAELAPRDIVSRAAFEEQKKGTVFLDITHRSEKELRKKFPTIFAHLKRYGYDLSKDLVPITPAAHYLCGGIVAGVDGKTNIANLYAVGEVACTGLQGANRLASNSLLEAAVMSEHVMDSPLPVIKKFPGFRVQRRNATTLSKTGTKQIKTLRTQLQKTMWQCAGIVRTKKLLNAGLKQLQTIKKRLQKSENTSALELQNMILTAEIIIKAALRRRKTLGAHYRQN